MLGIIKDGFLILGTSSFALDLVTGLTILLAMILNVQIERATSMRGRRGSFGHAISLVFSIFAQREKGKDALMTPNDGTNGPAGVQDVLRTEQISMSFGPVVALRSVDLHLQRGEILGLVGDNGAGKSTLVKILTGLYRPDGGRIYLDGERG